MSTLLDRLSALQNNVRRDPSSYGEEFRLQHGAFQAELGILQLHLHKDNEAFRQLTSFMTHVAPCFPKDCAGLPGALLALLGEHAAALHPEVRRCVTKALIQLRARGLLEDPLPLLKACFALFRIKDRALREAMFQHIVSDCRALSLAGGSSAGATTRAVQAFMYTMLADSSSVAARKSLEVLVELYRRQVWTDARCVNVVASALGSKNVKVVVVALKFFLGMSAAGEGGDGEHLEDIESSEDEGGNRRAAAGAVGGVSRANQQEIEKNLAHVKKTRKRKRSAAKAFADIKRAQRKAARRGDGVAPVFPAIQVLHDPQGVAEGLLASVARGVLSKEKFEVRLLALNFATRVVGQHRLLLLPLYSFLQRYLAAHQANVTQVLSYAIQATHDDVPPEELVPMVKAVANGFVHESAKPEVMQVGINSLREIFSRCPGLLAEPALEGIVGDLCAYKGYKGSKGVVAAARAVTNLVRDWYPALLKRKERGKELGLAGAAAVAARRPSVFGARAPARGVEGEDLLAMVLARKDMRLNEREGAEEEEEEGEGEGEGRGGSERPKKMRRVMDGAGILQRVAGVADKDEWARVERDKEKRNGVTRRKRVVEESEGSWQIQSR